MAITTTLESARQVALASIHVPDNVRALDDAHVKALLGVFRCSPTARGSGDRDGNLVADNRVHDNDEGIAVCCSDSNVVEDNAVFDNKVNGIAVFFGSDSHNVIRHNRVSGNGDNGIFVGHQEGEQRNVVEANAVSGNGGPGILLDDANANEVRANRVARNGAGIGVFGGPATGSPATTSPARSDAPTAAAGPASSSQDRPTSVPSTTRSPTRCWTASASPHSRKTCRQPTASCARTWSATPE